MTKLIRSTMDRLYAVRRLSPLKPVLNAADAALFGTDETTGDRPHIADSIDLKRYMLAVIIALLPSTLASIYFFGWRVVWMIIVSYVAGGLVEVIFAIVRKQEIHEGFFVTGIIFPLVLPPTTPLWIVAVGVIFGVFFGKEVFGGTGRNLFNPALVGRCFLALGYPSAMAGSWISPGSGTLGNLLKNYQLAAPEAISSATPLVQAKSGVLTPI
ncbi:MAG: RnfABCDGE type electron transport complex subunit D, partial [Candidatus Latescibacteria bacterium]|nr:RnfABCDGE type electron transport complex subunit D [Candidatus Latescibacterota bacterium]